MAKQKRVYLLCVLLFSQTSCGLLLYPERRGQTSGQIDPAIAILDGIGVLFYVVPGLAAFAVDFYTGTIYLPRTRGKKAQLSTSPEPRIIETQNLNLDQQTIESILFKELEIPISLTDPRLKTYYPKSMQALNAALDQYAL